MTISDISAYEIIASNGYPSIEVRVTLSSGVVGTASVSYGLSDGAREARTLLDGDSKRYDGKGMVNNVTIINETIAPTLLGKNAHNQRLIDWKLLELDDSPLKSKFGGNTILGVSLAVARAASNSMRVPLYRYLRENFSIPLKEFTLPHPMIVVIEGGAHADNSTDFQEYLISVLKKDTAPEMIRSALEIYHTTKRVLHEKGLGTNVGTEGAFAPEGISSNSLPLELLETAIQKAGYENGKDVGISIDVAASEFFKDKKYSLTKENKTLSSKEMIHYYESLVSKYHLFSIEDGLHEDDWDNWKLLNATLQADTVKCIGDDLTVTNIKLLKKAFEDKSISGIIIKPNQIGTITETIDACMLALQNDIDIIPSHRGGGETNDTSLVDIAVAVNAPFLKTGPTRGERVAKWNRLMEIERELLLAS